MPDFCVQVVHDNEYSAVVSIALPMTREWVKASLIIAAIGGVALTVLFGIALAMVDRWWPVEKLFAFPPMLMSFPAGFLSILWLVARTHVGSLRVEVTPQALDVMQKLP